MKEETPIKIVKHKEGKHEIETRIFARNIHETYCSQKGCRFKGKRAAQGVCFSKLGQVEQSYLDNVGKRAGQMLKEFQSLRPKMTTAQYIERLESTLFCTYMNSEFGLDELIRMRAEMSILKNKVLRGQKARKTLAAINLGGNRR